MPWTMHDYPSSLKNLNRTVRKKAIDIANTMVEEGYRESEAISIATRQAKEWYDNASQSEINAFDAQGNPAETDPANNARPELLDKGEHVVPHDQEWAVQAEEAKNPSAVYSTKDEAIQNGKKVAKNKGTSLTIHRQDGTIEQHLNYR